MKRLCLAMASLVVSLAGCPAQSPPAMVQLPQTQPSADLSELALALSHLARADGNVELSAMPEARPHLEAQLARLAVTGPHSTPELYPTDQARWAYWFNARLAWSLMLAQLEGWPESPPIEMMMQRPFRLDAQVTTLAQLDALLEAQARAAGEFRLLAAAPGACLEDAPLPRQPFRAEGFDQALAVQFERVLADRRRVVIDIDLHQVRLPSHLWQVRDLLERRYQRQYGPSLGANILTQLLSLADPAGRRRLQSAIGYEVLPPQRSRCRLALPPRMGYSPGRIGRVELGGGQD